MNSEFMQKIVELAKSVKVDIPVAALLAKDDEIIAVATNQKEQKNNATYHAEMLVIDEASKKLGRWRLNDCDLYVTLEPCAMCAGAIGWAQVRRLVYGANDPKRGYSLFAPQVLHPKCSVSSGILANDCQTLVQSFFIKQRVSASKL